MLRMHEAGDTYLVAFEYHDDVLFLTPSKVPTDADFCQVKTSDTVSARKLSSLTSRPKGKPSILAKMFSNFEGICASHDVRVTLVSNNAFEFSDNDVCAKDIDEKFRNKLVKGLREEIPDFGEEHLEKLHFKVTGVSLDAMQSFLEGEALNLFCEKFGDDHGLNVRTWIRLIKGEIARKNNYPSDAIKNTKDLVRAKCISQAFVEETLNYMHSKARVPLDTALISRDLERKGWRSTELLRILKKIPQAGNDFYNPLNSDVREIVECMHMVRLDDGGNLVELSNFLNLVPDHLKRSIELSNPYTDQYYLYALAIVFYNDEL